MQCLCVTVSRVLLAVSHTNFRTRAVRFAFALHATPRLRGAEDYRRPSTPPSSWRAQASHPQGQGSPLWPQSSVGSGMAAGAAFGQRRVRDVGAVRSFSTLCNVNDPITHAIRQQVSRAGQSKQRNTQRNVLNAAQSRGVKCAPSPFDCPSVSITAMQGFASTVAQRIVCLATRILRADWVACRENVGDS